MSAWESKQNKQYNHLGEDQLWLFLAHSQPVIFYVKITLLTVSSETSKDFCFAINFAFLFALLSSLELNENPADVNSLLTISTTTP